jgi:Domain of unknown function (DUF4148)
MKRTTFLLLALAAAAPVLANDVDPFGFEAEHFVSSRTRNEVQVELRQAQRSGALPVAGEIGMQFVDAPSSKTRTQVAAETLEARRLGLLDSRGELGPVLATPEQERLIELAGVRALGVAATK